MNIIARLKLLACSFVILNFIQKVFRVIMVLGVEILIFTVVCLR